MDLDRTISRQAGRNLGIVTRAGLLEAGIPQASVNRRVRSGLLKRILPGTYIVDGFPETIEARALAATIWAGPCSFASHRCCARLFRLDDARNIVELTSTRKKSGAPERVVLHHCREMDPRDVTRIGIIPVTTPTRMLVDVGSVVTEETLETWLDQSLREGRTSIRRLRDVMDRCGGKGRRGVSALRRLLRDRDPEAAPNESRLETKVARVIRRAGLPPVQPQRVIYDGGGYVGRIDFVFPERRLVVEAHSYKYHSSFRAWDVDVERWNRLRRGGWRIVLVTWRNVLTDPDGVVEDIRAECAKDQLFFP